MTTQNNSEIPINEYLKRFPQKVDKVKSKLTDKEIADIQAETTKKIFEEVQTKKPIPVTITQDVYYTKEFEDKRLLFYTTNSYTFTRDIKIVELGHSLNGNLAADVVTISIAGRLVATLTGVTTAAVYTDYTGTLLKAGETMTLTSTNDLSAFGWEYYLKGFYWDTQNS